jgi:hypothetical protein
MTLKAHCPWCKQTAACKEVQPLLDRWNVQCGKCGLWFSRSRRPNSIKEKQNEIHIGSSAPAGSVHGKQAFATDL